MDVFDRTTYPAGLKPPGEGWMMVEDQGPFALWRRPGPVLAALTDLMDWTRSHARLDGPDGASAVLMRAAEAVDQAVADEIGQ